MLYILVPLVRFELTNYTPLFERGDFTKICPQGHWLGCLMGIEPTHIGITTRGLNHLAMVNPKYTLEQATYPIILRLSWRVLAGPERIELPLPGS